MAAHHETKDEKLAELKGHLTSLQEKIADLEGTHKEVRELISWTSPIRIYRQKSTRWGINLLLMIFIILVILLYVKQFILMAAVLALAFLVYAMEAVEPENMEHKITTEGLNTAGSSYLWEELYDFWFVDKGEWKILHVDTVLNFPRRLIILVKKDEAEKVKEILAKYIPFREQPHRSWLDRASETLSAQIHHLIGS